MSALGCFGLQRGKAKGTAAWAAARVRSVCDWKKKPFKLNEGGYECLYFQPIGFALPNQFPRERQ
jgi:hypothetical protein